MPFELKPPQAGRSQYYRVRGTECGIYLDRSTKTGDERKAQQFLRAWRDDAQRRALREAVAPEAKKAPVSFAAAALAYMQAGGERRFVAPLLRHFGETPIAEIDQAAIDAAAVAIHPGGTPATRNRQVYSPTSAILRRAGVALPLRRPKGGLGQRRTDHRSGRTPILVHAAFSRAGARNAKTAPPAAGADGAE